MEETADKTIIRSARRNTTDNTVVRPSPGRRSVNESQKAKTEAASVNINRPIIATNQSINPDILSQNITSNINDLISCSATLLGVYSHLKNTLTHNDEAGLYTRLINEIKLFEKHCKDLMIKPEIVLAARYILCSVLDEAIMNTPWGSGGNWSQHTLLSGFHNETAGGEKFFLLLDRMRETPAENIEILELMYLCLSIGFEGKYRVLHKGKEQIEIIREDLFAVIRNFRGEFERDLSFGWHGKNGTGSTLIEYIPVWVVASVFSLIIFVSYLGFHLWLTESSADVMKRIDTVTHVLNEKKHNQTKTGISHILPHARENDNIFKSRGVTNE